MPNPIPTKQRKAVTERDRGRCMRCGMAGNEWHHRRGRSVRDTHTHCTCNGITLCGRCHASVHASPASSRDDGFIVSRHNAEPGTVPLRTFRGEVLLSCNGAPQNFPDRKD